MLLQQLTLQNLLSFGDTPCVVPLRPLNVLIGPNGSGKSNFIEAVGLLKAAPGELTAPIRDSGDVEDWVWKGHSDRAASVEAVVCGLASLQLRHRIDFLSVLHSFALLGETIDRLSLVEDQIVSQQIYSYTCDLLSEVRVSLLVNDELRSLEPSELDLLKSVLAQRKDPQQFPEITFLGDQYERIQIYRDWSFGRYTKPRLPQKTTQRNDRLLEDFSNLGMMLNRLRRVSETKQRLLESLNQLYPNIDDFDVSVEGGTVQVFFQEGNFTIPATRLSDGTLRYLCLLVILLQPSPPPLVCIEEPELGLHPDVLPGLADLLREASQRMQLVVTTHSDILVDALSDTPEDIVICEKHDGATTMRRLESDKLKVWLEKYTLGELWCSGELGGNRW